MMPYIFYFQILPYVVDAYNTEWGDGTEINYTYTYGDHFIKELHGEEGYDISIN